MITKPKPGFLINPLHPLSRGLVGWWLFNEGGGSRANDYSGKGNHGTLTNMDLTSAWVGSPRGGAINFDGVNDRIVGPGNDVLAITGDVSFGAWVWRDTSTTDDFIVTYTVNGVDSAATNTLYELLIVATTNVLHAKWESGTGTNTVAVSSVAVSNPTGSWVHYMFVRDTVAKTLTFYENGIVLGEVQPYVNNASGGTESSLYIASDGSSSNTGHFDGRIDEARLWKRALNSTEVYQLVTNPYANVITPFSSFSKTSLVASVSNSIGNLGHFLRRRRR